MGGAVGGAVGGAAGGEGNEGGEGGTAKVPVLTATDAGATATPGTTVAAPTTRPPELSRATSPRNARTSARTLKEFHSNSTTSTTASNMSVTPKNMAMT